jgi:phosphoribosylformylglycinamidine synthase
MQFLVKIEIMPRKELLDPQGKAVTNGLNNIGCTQINDVRVGKCITYTTIADNETAAFAEAEHATTKLLANLIMESYNISITAL